jgi:hypothetical protein
MVRGAAGPVGWRRAVLWEGSEEAMGCGGGVPLGGVMGEEGGAGLPARGLVVERLAVNRWVAGWSAGWGANQFVVF